MHVHSTAFSFGDIVFLKTDRDQYPRIVVGIRLSPESQPFYELGCGADSSFHFGIEMSSTADDNVKFGISK